MTATAARLQSSRPSGWWGMALFVTGEATLFGTLFGTYLYLRLQSRHWPPNGIPSPKWALPLVLTAILVSTSLPVHDALASARRGRLGRARAALLVAACVQVAYLVVTLTLYDHDLHRLEPSASAYASIYFTLLGAHAAHVAAGILLEVWLFLRLLRGLTRYRLVGLQATAFYWHFVNALAVLVVAVQLSPLL
ncbi:MAG TPA: cytochrome c oxidase subunit 3 [Gaiellaceae bacterium]|nr:cytochrome c oxidase subunit 3 [Gaiellaceae bacterium]